MKPLNFKTIIETTLFFIIIMVLTIGIHKVNNDLTKNMSNYLNNNGIIYENIQCSYIQKECMFSKLKLNNNNQEFELKNVTIQNLNEVIQFPNYGDYDVSLKFNDIYLNHKPLLLNEEIQSYLNLKHLPKEIELINLRTLKGELKFRGNYSKDGFKGILNTQLSNNAFTLNIKAFNEEMIPITSLNTLLSFSNVVKKLILRKVEINTHSQLLSYYLYNNYYNKTFKTIQEFNDYVTTDSSQLQDLKKCFKENKKCSLVLHNKAKNPFPTSIEDVLNNFNITSSPYL